MKAVDKVDRPLRIAFVTSVQGWGGSELLWSEAARKLAARGHHVRAFVTGPPPPVVAALKGSGVRVSRLFPRWVPFSLRARLADHLRAFVWLWQTARLGAGLVLGPRPDLVVVSQGGNYDGLLLASVCRRLGLRYVVISHKADAAYWPSGAVLPRLRRVFEQAAWCFFVSEHNRRLTEEQLGQRLPRASVAKNPYQVRWRTDESWPAGEGLRLACVGRMSVRDKGQDLLIRVLARPKWRRRAVAVSFIGDGPDAGSLRRLARLLGVEASFPGPLQDIEGVWRDHHALVLPSRAEGMPVVTVEAMLCGRPVVCTRAGGAGELVEDGRTGFLAAAPTEEALDEALERACAARKQLRQMGAAAAERARDFAPRDAGGLFADQLLAVVGGQEPAPETPRRQTPPLARGKGLDGAIARAVAFMAERQLLDGSFEVLISNDPTMGQGCTPDPSIFPTALAAHCLGAAPEAADVQRRALDYLLAEMEPEGLWKHWPREHPQQRQLPPDLDDTCCASAALRDAGIEPPDNRALLLANRSRGGLFYTWFTPRPALPLTGVALRQLGHPLVLLAFFTQTSARPGDIDAIVNANALHYLGHSPQTQPIVDHMASVLREGTEADCDKWYESPFAAWYFFARAAGCLPEIAALITPKLKAAKPRNALEQALAISAGLYCGERPSQAEVNALVAAQRPDGSWPRAAIYFGGRLRRRDGTMAAAHRDTPRWGSHEVTTAYCLEALARYRSLTPR